MSEYLRLAFSGLPHVIGDTRALIAYVVAIAGWVVVALRVKRNQNLLLHLRRLPEKDRLPALQAEMGALPVPAGMTPIQYLTARVHNYYFRAFVILCILIAAIVALALTYHPASSAPIPREEISRAFQDALQADRQRTAANAANVRIQDAQTKIEAMELSRIPEYYVQEFGAPAKRSITKGVLELDWINDLYELDIEFVNGTSVTYCLISQSANFKPKVPATHEEPPPEEVRLGEAALAELADAYLSNNWGSGGGASVAHYGPSGSNADDSLYGFVAVVSSRAEYPKIKGSDQLRQLTPADSQACCSSPTQPVAAADPINAFAVTIDHPSEHPRSERPPVPSCLMFPR